MRSIIANLAPALGRQDHTISPSAIHVIRLMTRRVHRIPLPTFVTIAKRPSCGCGTSERKPLIWGEDQPDGMRQINTTGSHTSRTLSTFARIVEWAKRKRAHHFRNDSGRDGGHGATRLCPPYDFSPPSFRGDAKHRT